MSREPETPGHEKLFREQLGQDPLRAKLSTRAVHYLGQILANETRQGRRGRTIVDEIVKSKDCSTLAIARRAKRFRDECDLDGASVALDRAAKRAGLCLAPSSSVDLSRRRPNETKRLVENSDERQCYWRPICRQRAGGQFQRHLIHEMLLRMLEHEGNIPLIRILISMTAISWTPSLKLTDWR